MAWWLLRVWKLRCCTIGAKKLPVCGKVDEAINIIWGGGVKTFNWGEKRFMTSGGTYAKK